MFTVPSGSALSSADSRFFPTRAEGYKRQGGDVVHDSTTGPGWLALLVAGPSLPLMQDPTEGGQLESDFRRLSL